MWCTSALYNSPSNSLKCLNIFVLSCSYILEIKFWRNAKIALLPKSINLTSSETSSPISKSGSINFASANSISSLSSSEKPSATTTLFLHISKSPLSGLIIISKLSSEPNFRFKVALKTSSKIDINVTLSILLLSLNSENESINAIFSIAFILKIRFSLLLP